jgi:heterodisulfide reductase subunit C
VIRYDAEAAAQLRDSILQRVKTDVTACYQCGNCTASCPAVFTFDLTPNQVMRMLQVGLVDEVLRSKSVQLCVQCMTCTARCPREIDVAGVFEDLKTVAFARRLDVPEDARVFNKAFLDNVARFGRLSEAFFLLRYNLASRHLLNDVELGLPMVGKGKVQVIPKKAAGTGEVARIYRKALDKARARERVS